MGKKHKRNHTALSISNPVVQNKIMEWKEKREETHRKREIQRENRIKAESSSSSSKPSTKTERNQSITSIKTKEDVDSAINFFLWPRPVYNQEIDFQFQDMIGKQDELLDYYHQKMTNYFGIEHKLKSEYKKINQLKETTITKPQVNKTIRIKNIKSDDNNPVTQTDPIPFEKEPDEKKSIPYVLDWEFVEFHEKYFVIFTSDKKKFDFVPKRVYCEKARTPFNYIRKYLKTKLGTIYCEIVNQNLMILNPILIDDAIQIFANTARQRNLIVPNKSKKTAPVKIPFERALSKAQEMKPEDFAKYKSSYIAYLVTKQCEDYKIIPCVEMLAHVDNDITEDSFLFSTLTKKGNILVIQENLNPDRATLLFVIRKFMYDNTIRNIYNFLQSTEINKRSRIRNHSFLIKDNKILSYSAINHDDFDTWKKGIESIISSNKKPKTEVN